MQLAYDQCQKVAGGEAWCGFLPGTPGNRKTHLAIAAINAYEGPARFWKVPDFLAFLRRHVPEGDSEDIVGRYAGEEFLLVLDDLGAEKETDWASEQIYRILDRRSDEHLPTIITSNADRIDERLRSRYREGYVPCAGKDRR